MAGIFEIDVSDVERLARSLLARADAVEQTIPDSFRQGVIEGREELKPEWTAPIGFTSNAPGQDQQAHMLYRPGITSVRRRVMPRTYGRQRKPRKTVLQRRRGGPGGRQDIAPELAATSMVSKINEVVTPQIFDIVTRP